MEVILLDKVENLGNLGELVEVKSGYGRNFLIPSGKAVFASAKNREKFEQQRKELEAVAAKVLQEAESRKAAITALTSVTITRPAGEEGKLFGSVGTADIAEAISAAGTEVKKQEVRLSSGSIRQVGEFTIDLHLHPEVNTTVIVNIEPEAS